MRGGSAPRSYAARDQPMTPSQAARACVAVRSPTGGTASSPSVGPSVCSRDPVPDSARAAAYRASAAAWEADEDTYTGGSYDCHSEELTSPYQPPAPVPARRPPQHRDPECTDDDTASCSSAVSAAQRRAAAAEARARALHRAWVSDSAKHGNLAAQRVAPRRGDHAPPAALSAAELQSRQRCRFGSTPSVRSRSSSSSLPFDLVVERCADDVSVTSTGSRREVIRAGSRVADHGRRMLAGADAAREDAAAAAMQRCWRHHRACGPARQRLATRARARRRRWRDAESRERKNAAAVVLQSVWRGTLVRRSLSEFCGHDIADC
eukprot:TRINITY_DN13590_c0_g1_i1.p2 TRINITY_DN13590_c0_g1~~TRINITY_DN13590_c0_g1_i1.p2  ORF type:complete len:322 (+),score=94.36 TRINITY_DN13590_c0_g1_i1:61-1026(+)